MTHHETANGNGTLRTLTKLWPFILALLSLGFAAGTVTDALRIRSNVVQVQTELSAHKQAQRDTIDQIRKDVAEIRDDVKTLLKQGK